MSRWYREQLAPRRRERFKLWMEWRRQRRVFGRLYGLAISELRR